MLNIVIPMAGRGSRFLEEGYTLPKPLIPVLGVPMCRVVIDNLRPSCPHRFVFIAQQSHLDQGLEEVLKSTAPTCTILSLKEVTGGAACTVLLARELIDNEDQLMIANCDQYVDLNIDLYLSQLKEDNLEGLIMTMQAYSSKWSYVGTSGGRVIRVVEKEVISDKATVGVYNFRRGKEFVSAAEEMIARNLRTNGEFYVAPVYNQMIEKGAKIGTFSTGSVRSGMWGLGTPEDLKNYEYDRQYMIREPK